MAFREDANSISQFPSFLIAWVVGTLFILWSLIGLKRVRIDSTTLYISNYLREIRVPFGMVTRIDENRLINIRPITIQFRSPTEFGQHIKFMPRARLLLPWSMHPVVNELSRLAGIPADKTS